MEQKTRVYPKDGKQYIIITRESNLPLRFLFKAYPAPELFGLWIEKKVLKMENKKHGSYASETLRNGNVVFQATRIYS